MKRPALLVLALAVVLAAAACSSSLTGPKGCDIVTQTGSSAC